MCSLNGKLRGAPWDLPPTHPSQYEEVGIWQSHTAWETNNLQREGIKRARGMYASTPHSRVLTFKGVDRWSSLRHTLSRYHIPASCNQIHAAPFETTMGVPNTLVFFHHFTSSHIALLQFDHIPYQENDCSRVIYHGYILQSWNNLKYCCTIEFEKRK